MDAYFQRSTATADHLEKTLAHQFVPLRDEGSALARPLAMACPPQSGESALNSSFLSQIFSASGAGPLLMSSLTVGFTVEAACFPNHPCILSVYKVAQQDRTEQGRGSGASEMILSYRWAWRKEPARSQISKLQRSFPDSRTSLEYVLRE